MKALGALAVLLLLLAGCGGKSGSDASPTASPTTTHRPSATLDVSMDRPVWRFGQSWEYSVEILGTPTTRFTMVVAADTGDLWIVGTENRSKALHHALYSSNPVLGRILKETLSPYQSGEPVRMFEFPLTDRKSWDATFFGETMRFAAVFDEGVATLPRVFLPGFEITAAGPSGQRVEYHYVEAVEWFSEFVYWNETGVKQIHLTLEAFGADYQGEYFFLRGRDRFAETFEASTDAIDAPTFTIDEGDSFDALGVGFIAEGRGETQAIINVTLTDPAGTARVQRQYLLPDGELALESLETASVAGDWKVDVLIVGAAVVEVRVAGLEATTGRL